MSTQPNSGDVNPAAWASGWVAFAGFLLIIGGGFWALSGLAALLEDTFYVVGREYAFEVDVTTWGWINLIGGVITILAGCYVFTGNILARLFGIAVAIGAVFTNFVYIPYYPIWSILVIVLMVIVIFALAVYSTDAARAKDAARAE